MLNGITIAVSRRDRASLAALVAEALDRTRPGLPLKKAGVAPLDKNSRKTTARVAHDRGVGGV
jgi:hypothetical protein